MQRNRVETVADQGALQNTDIAFAIAEDQGVFDILAVQQATQRGPLVPRPDGDQSLEHGVGRGGGRGDRDFLRIHQEFFTNAANFRRHGGREEQGLAKTRQQADDAFHVGNEAHVEHPVGFVDDQDFDVAEQHLAALEMVEKAARRGNQHVDAAVQFLFLFIERNTADEQGHGQFMVLTVGFEIAGHLGRQFPRRRDDQ